MHYAGFIYLKKVEPAKVGDKLLSGDKYASSARQCNNNNYTLKCYDDLFLLLIQSLFQTLIQSW